MITAKEFDAMPIGTHLINEDIPDAIEVLTQRDPHGFTLEDITGGGSVSLPARTPEQIERYLETHRVATPEEIKRLEPKIKAHNDETEKSKHKAKIAFGQLVEHLRKEPLTVPVLDKTGSKLIGRSRFDIGALMHMGSEAGLGEMFKDSNTRQYLYLNNEQGTLHHSFEAFFTHDTKWPVLPLVPEHSTDEELLLRYFKHQTGEELYSHPGAAQVTFEAIKQHVADGGGLTREAFNTFKSNPEITRLAAKHRRHNAEKASAQIPGKKEIAK